MPVKIPVNFKEKLILPPSIKGGGYPFRISASDLDRNFAYCAIDVEEGWVEETSVGDLPTRKLNLPKKPASGTFVLGCVDGTIQWIETEAC